MKLFEITNGFIGDSYVRILVVAETDDRAIEIARPIFKNEAEDEKRYPESYWIRLDANLLCDDLSEEWNSKIID